MRFSLEFSETYPHPADAVWRALTDRDALGRWLMETDFVAERGRAFTMWCDDGAGGTDTYDCKVLDIDPPRRMVWSWRLADRSKEPPTTVEFRIEEVEGGTRVTITHSGDRDQATIDRFRSGWPWKLEGLAKALADA